MIGGIRRKLTSIDHERLWDANLDLQPEVEERTELPIDSANQLTAARATAEFSPKTNMSDYYAGVVRAAITQGGRFGDFQISLPWLRKILAGLEWRSVDPETLWDEVDSSVPSVPDAQIPVYDELFHSNG